MSVGGVVDIVEGAGGELFSRMIAAVSGLI